METAECWALALARSNGPSVMVLSRQGLPALRDGGDDNLCARGAYVLAEASGERRATLLATGSEVQVALAARERLEADGVATAVVSMPCWELFAIQELDYRDSVLGPDTVRVAVEDPYDLTRLDSIKAMNLAPRYEFLVGLRDDILDYVRKSYGETGPVVEEADLGRIILDLGAGEEDELETAPATH